MRIEISVKTPYGTQEFSTDAVVTAEDLRKAKARSFGENYFITWHFGDNAVSLLHGSCAKEIPVPGDSRNVGAIIDAMLEHDCGGME